MKNREKIMATLVLLGSILMHSSSERKVNDNNRAVSNVNYRYTQNEDKQPKNIEVIDMNDLEPVGCYGFTTDDTMLYKSPISKKVLFSVDRESLLYVVGSYLGYSQVVYEISEGLSAVGYIPSNQIELFDNEFIDVDISNQLLRFINGNKSMKQGPTVTGVPGEKHTETGCYQLYDKQRSAILRGKDYAVYVDYWMPYNGAQGMHDAEYHCCDEGGSHGWRNHDEFGGKTYINSGSHGCVNLHNDMAKYIYENARIGTKVFVHK